MKENLSSIGVVIITERRMPDPSLRHSPLLSLPLITLLMHLHLDLATNLLTTISSMHTELATISYDSLKLRDCCYDHALNLKAT